ncbi:pyridoxamine 5'-phosphate oxidase family protein [Herbaspirillum sp.]|jgi:ferredoxin-NADP reductase/predicted pyridoxine 5'-phosphate oxidase superfamily flavin-nucleotide-binding protein|uniref:FAD-binding oxidoreductase n=1 Tax=Herbaspirillum TaxID=963 RepID=UPI002590D561|nr:pyridoxamine 5'-phosphate oxidase family protein [Herbaspirillum sp.]MCP3655986.1 2Fe-2S iron-sulfur cluster binding domain-containing protein [Herbaspirillum sp.]MCP3948173.1 2Fe-2S iron-sulfur cluster binding domain-containing protein [Herbaspirillum sp.]MCP4030814.1 2Fe-2S iron-sulfur cluster binding domain-containing protein [Herbaspirillum sp.]MCP4557651.1 2Fe-2S iron-sulfur cluster binding domain-containing protein [Herbaspirillum sp.]
MSASPKSPVWHAGEKQLQAQLGVADKMESVGQRVIRDFMPEQHRDFYGQLPFIVVGSVDPSGDAWATFLEGRPGFLASPSPTRLDMHARPPAEDPAAAGMSAGAPVGLLGIEMHTRRRNRMNGVLAPLADGWGVQVDQSFGNCPRYIQLRDYSFAQDPAEARNVQAESLDTLDAPALALIAGADAFFVATYADQEGRRQVDVSHRGGKPGFVRVDEAGVLTVPDFNGNLFFSTLGNIVLNGRAGLLFVDYASGDVLQMTGQAEVILDSPEIAAFEGAERLWTFRPQRIVRRRAALALRWAFQEHAFSSYALMTGDWQQAAERLRAQALAGQWRSLKVARIVQESETIRSFHLVADDGAGLLPALPGQHLPIRVRTEAGAAPLIRTYTLSSAPHEGHYRISVKREGVVSQYLHAQLREGDRIEARAPAGDFTLDTATDRPVVLLAGGVGITPMMAMLRHIVQEGVRRQRMRPVILFYAARTLGERAFDAELAELVAASRGGVRLVRVLSDTTGAREGDAFDAAGRIDMNLLSRSLPFGDYEFYLCGPGGFMQGLYDGLRGFGISDERIHAEAFGPASLTRTGNTVAAAVPLAPVAETAVPVIFMESLKEARWTPDSGSLLELAEARGLSPEFSCREGHCGSCRTRLLAGEVTYLKPPQASVGEGEVLLCCARPAKPSGTDAPRLELAL